MKCLLIISFLWITISYSYGQIILVNHSDYEQSKYSPKQLVEEVLIVSDCSEIGNFSSQVYGQPDDLSSKSYGYFKTPNGSSFPFKEGIILTTGRAYPAGNLVNTDILSFDNEISGDSDIESALKINDTYNATYFKFYFTPLVDEISFRYLMASEEYDGSTECSFADSFAFLLREEGSQTYTNLAVLPDGTPVSVTNINDATTCQRNPSYFAGYNPNTTNYGGHTKILTAKSVVTPGKTYEIKLVVADQGDKIWDSAIFLEAGSFDLGGDLGDDQTNANGNPGCKGTPITLDTKLANPNLNFKWYKNNVLIPDANSSKLQVESNGTYKFEAVAGSCRTSDEVVIEFAVPPTISAPPKNILRCETDNDQKEIFDFSDNEKLVLGNQNVSDFKITYHISQTHAEQNQNPLSVPYTNNKQKETIWMRIADKTQSCYKTVNFNIEVQSQAKAFKTADYELCDDNSDGDNTNGISTFDLTTKINDIIKDQLLSDIRIRFYDTQSAADAGTTSQILPTTLKNTSNPQSVFARVENKLNSNCYATTEFKLKVNPLPVVANEVELKQCDTDSDGKAKFNLTEVQSLISDDHEQLVFSFYETQAEALTKTNPIENPISYENSTKTNDVIYARIETKNNCFRTSKINLIVGATQLESSFKLEYNVCDDKKSDNDNTNGIAAFNFEDATAKILNQLPTNQNLEVSYYESESDALLEQNPITDISNHRNSNAPKTQQIYVRIESKDINACLGLGPHITLNVLPLPKQQSIADFSACSETDKANFNLTTMDGKIKGDQTDNLHITYHLTASDAENNIPISNPENFTNTSNPQTIFVRVFYDKNNNQIMDIGECARTDISFKLQVHLNPKIAIPKPIVMCSDSLKAEFDLTQRANEITNNDDTISLTYYETKEDLENDQPILNPKKFISAQLKKTIYVLAKGKNKCDSTTTMELKILFFENFNINPTPIEECEVDTDGLDLFDLTLREQQILNNLDPSKFSFTYYENQSDAEQGNSKNIKTPSNYKNTTKGEQIIFIRVKPNDNNCFVIIRLRILVHQVPKIDIEDQYLLCFNSNNILIKPIGLTQLISPPIDTKLDSKNYTFLWYSATKTQVENNPNDNIIEGEVGPILKVTQPGHYTVVATNKSTLCRISASTIVVKSSPPEEITTEILQPEFSSPNSVKVNVIGNGDYEYALDDGPWQKDNILKNVHYGEHTILVRDRFGCGIKSIKITIIDYPKYFTPNGDGYHDTWNISSLKSQANAKIYIFDRYGKLLKMISPASRGWDGTFNGKPMPASDYWFLIEYLDSGKAAKHFRAHFTLKR